MNIKTAVVAFACLIANFVFSEKINAQSRSARSRTTDEPSSRFAVGVAPFSIILPTGKINLRAELPYRPRTSLALTLGIPKKSKIPELVENCFEVAPDDAVESKVKSQSWRSFGLILENRFYLGGPGAPRGFYLAPYARYNRFAVTHTIENQANNTETNITGAIGGFGFGGAAGAQFSIGERLTLDITLVGIEGKLMRGTFRYQTNDPDNDVLAYRDKIVEKLDGIPFIGNRLSDQIDGDEVKVRTPGVLVPGLRFNFTVNYTF